MSRAEQPCDVRVGEEGGGGGGWGGREEGDRNIQKKFVQGQVTKKIQAK